jgi:hypothetical protein
MTVEVNPHRMSGKGNLANCSFALLVPRSLASPTHPADRADGIAGTLLFRLQSGHLSQARNQTVAAFRREVGRSKCQVGHELGQKNVTSQ